MENKALPMPVVIGIIVAVVLLVGFFGFRAISGRSTDSKGNDLSSAGVQPSSAANADTQQHK